VAFPYSHLVSIADVPDFLRPTDLAAALAAVKGGAIPVSGGTDVMLRRPSAPAPMVDLTVLPLTGIGEAGGGFTIGANTTLSEMLEHPGIAAFADGVIADMLRLVGSPLLRNRATIGGHLARGRLSDVIPVLVALDATITWHDGSDHTALLADFYAAGTHRTPMIVTAAGLPPLNRPTGAAFLKFSRTHYDLAILNCACRVDVGDDGTVATSRIVVGETPALGARVGDAEAMLHDHPLVPSTIAAAAKIAAAEIPARDDDRASAEYRRAIAEVLVRRCLTEIGARLP
jgi:CO/xanthine dehydrogenase FAD-binding subunit